MINSYSEVSVCLGKGILHLGDKEPPGFRSASELHEPQGSTTMSIFSIITDVGNVQRVGVWNIFY